MTSNDTTSDPFAPIPEYKSTKTVLVLGASVSDGYSIHRIDVVGTSAVIDSIVFSVNPLLIVCWSYSSSIAGPGVACWMASRSHREEYALPS